MSIVTLGLNHHTAPLGVRERVVFHVERLREALGEIKGSLAREAAILSTCNRTELYLDGEEPAAVVHWLAKYHDLAPGELAPYLYTHPAERAASFIWPRISGSPSTIESSPEATRNACRTACSRGRVYR